MIAPEHKFVFSTGQSIKSGKVRGRTITWSNAKSMFSRHTRTTERKTGKYYCAGVFRENYRDKAHHQKSSMLTLDCDNVSESLPELMDRVRRGTRSGFLAYSTFRHKPEAPRVRILIPLDRYVSADEYKALVESVAKRIGIPIDVCSHSAVQPMFFPKAPPGAEVFTYTEDTTLFRVDSHLEQSGFLGHASSDSSRQREFDPTEADNGVSIEDTDFGLLDHEQILLKLIFASFPASGLGWQEWFDLILVVFHKFRGSLEARDLCQEWSAESDKHDPREIPRKWSTLSRERGEKKFGFPKLKAMIENRGGPDPAGLEFLSELADSVSEDSYCRITEGISSAPGWLLIDIQRDTLAQTLHERVGVELNRSLYQIGSELQPTSHSPDALQISRETKAVYVHRLCNASSEVELDRLIHNLASDDSIDQHYHLPELYPIIAAKRRELNLPLPNERQIKAQVESIRKQSGLSGSGNKPPYSGLIQRYSELAGWYQSIDTDELMLSKEHTQLKTCDVPLRSMSMENTFRREFYSSHKGALDDKQISTIQSTLEALLLGSVPAHKVYVRAAELVDGAVLIDTHWEDGNNILVHRDESGYSFTKEQLARFSRPPGAGALPKIELDEPFDRELIWQFWPGITDDEKLLVAARNIEVYRPHTPTPLLAVISSLPGIGKTYRLKANMEIFDPCEGSLIVKPRNADDLAMALNQFNSVTIDNLTELGPVYQDMLCNAVTDGRYVKRMHHRNTDTVSAHVKCNVGATSIHEGACVFRRS